MTLITPVPELTALHMHALRQGSAKLAAELAQAGVRQAEIHAALLVLATRAVLIDEVTREARGLELQASFARDDLAVTLKAPTFALIQPVAPVARTLALDAGHVTPVFQAWMQAHQGAPDTAAARLLAQVDALVPLRAVALHLSAYALARHRGEAEGPARLHAGAVAWRGTGLRPVAGWVQVPGTPLGAHA
ncbi:hypothetical protein [Deinococcus multiflagellatus]|uniref:hypothetical protein n=1 Tax=Deinococcus multiflagellatus TaxID=1656887 RepID=UPI001CC9CE24|nr:hypothetical protein [Deinococcus multiflagellatus]MBZ9715620.1 hypothetical protein [Deinococcus multiflagellatus]